MNMKIMMIIMILISIALSQGGGGGGSSSSSSSSGSSDYSSDQDSQSCAEQCQGREDFSSCETACEEDNKRTLIIVGCILGPLAGIGIIYYIYKNRVQLKNKFFGGKVKKNLKNEFLRSIGIHNDHIQFESPMSAINNREWECTFWQGSTAYHVNDFHLYGYQNAQTGEVEIVVNGEDKFGKWNGNGVVACDSTSRIHIWFLKNYQDKRKAGQTGNWTTLIYQGEKDIELQTFNGRWWYDGFSEDAKYSGAWTMQNHTIITETNN